MGLDCTIKPVQVCHLGDIMATHRRDVPDSSRLQTATVAAVVRPDISHINRVDRCLLLSHGLDDHCRRSVGGQF